MKQLISFLIFILITGALQSQLNFKQHNLAEHEFFAFENTFSADMDLDNDYDIVISSVDVDQLCWYKNLGNGSLSEKIVIDSNAHNINNMLGVDIDSDGDVDICVSTNYNKRLAWYENDGFGSFFYHIIDSFNSNVGIQAIHPCDLDIDGDIDLLICRTDNKIGWYVNDGYGGFGAFQLISTDAIFPSSVNSADLDGDDDLDVLSISVLDKKVAWYENLGFGSWGAQNVISTQVFYGHHISAFDFDDDGDEDVVTASNYKIAWYENDSTGNFGPQQIISDEIYGYSVRLDDLDSDNDLDIVAASVSSVYGSRPMVWFENTGGGYSSSDTINIFPYADICFPDLNLDGNKDIVTVAGGELLVYFADSLQNFASPIRVTDAFYVPDELAYCDLDGDTLNDIVVGSSDYCRPLCWYKNHGGGDYNIEDTIIKQRIEVYDMELEDLNNDGLVDIVVYCWYDNLNCVGTVLQDSSAAFGELSLVVDSLYVGSSLQVADMDGDGDSDIIFSSNNTGSSGHVGKISMWLNDGSGGFGNEIIVETRPDGVFDLKIADINADSLVDFVFSDGHLKWAKNLGGVNNFQYRNIMTYDYYVRKVYSADIDNDGDLDVAYTLDLPSLTAGYEYVGLAENNNFGSNPWSISIVDSIWALGEVQIVDLNLDNKLDIVVDYVQVGNDVNDKTLRCYLNDGQEGFDTSVVFMNVIKDSINITTYVIDDIDGDGDNDVLYNSINDGIVAWAENLGYQNNDSASSCANIPFQLGNQVLTTPGIYIDSLHTIYGLDSIVEVEFSHIPLPVVELDPFPFDTICIEEHFTPVPNGYPSGGNYLGVGISGIEINLDAAGIGMYDLAYAYTDTSTGCSDTAHAQMEIVVCTLIEETGDFIGVRLYPNPTNAILNIELYIDLNRSNTLSNMLELYSNDGRLLQMQQMQSVQQTIDLSSYNAGIYFLKISNGENYSLHKVVLR